MAQPPGVTQGVAVPFDTGDTFLNANFEALARAIQNIDPTALAEWDGNPPEGVAPLAAPGNLGADTFVDFNGQETIVSAVFSWGAVADAQSYIFKVTKVGDPDSYVQFVNTTTLRLSGLKPNTDYTFQVASVDVWGRAGIFSAPFPFTTPVDTNPPAQVAGLAVVRGLRTLIITWDSVVVSDLQDYQVQVATDAGFTGIVYDRVLQATFAQFEPSTAPATLTTYWVRVRARDVSGNNGTYSVSVTSTLGPTGTAGVDYAVFGGITADEITTGVLKAVVTLSGKFLTAPSGQRMEMDSQGLRGYDSGGNILANLATSGSPVFSLKTSVSGDRVEFSNASALRMIASGGAVAWKMDTDGLSIIVPAGSAPAFSGVDYFHSDGTTLIGGITITNAPTFDTNAIGLQLLSLGRTGATESYLELIAVPAGGGAEGYIALKTDDASAGGFFPADSNIIMNSGARTVRVQGPGFVIENGFLVNATSVAAGGTADINVSYGTAFPSAGPVPNLSGCARTLSGVRRQFWVAANHTRTGCTMACLNDGGGTANLSWAGFPVVV